MMNEKKLSPEEEYFAREEIAKLKKISTDKRRQMAACDAEQLKQLHWMHCAKCGHELHPVLFHGVTVDKCFECGGVFLDDGELEKLAGKESGFFGSILSLFKGE